MLEKERERDRHREIETETERNEINRLMGWREEEDGPIGKEKVRRGAWEAGFGCWPVRRASPSLTWGCCEHVMAVLWGHLVGGTVPR